MAKQINRTDIAEQDLFKNVRESAIKTLQDIAKLNKEFKDMATVLKNDIANAKFGNSAEIEKFVTATTKANKLKKESIQLSKLEKKTKQTKIQAEKELTKIKAEEIKRERELLKETRLLNTEKERAAKITEKNKKAIKDENTEYKKLVKTTRDQKNASKELAAQMLKLQNSGRGNSKAFRQLEQNYNKVTKAAQRGDKALKKIDGTVGDNFRNVGNYKSAIGGLSSMLGKLGLAFGIGSIVRGTFNTIKDFQQGQADLAAVLGDATVPELKALEAQAKALGATTTFTASEVAGLQKEFAKLGFDPQEIKNVTEATLLLAEATGTDIARAAEVAGATIRGFGLETTDTQRVVDVMAKSFSASSLDMEKFANSMSSVAPVANQFGFGVEKTTALLGTLTDRGIDASTAGTGLRNMFLDSNKAGLTFDEALEKIANSSDKTTASFDLFGKRGATLGVILAENRDSTAELTETLLDADLAAEKMAKTQRETLGGAIKLLGSAWDGFILSMNEAGGIGEKLRKGLVFIADNFENIIYWLGIAVKSFLAFKVALIGMKIARFVKGLGGFSGALQKVNTGLAKGKSSSKGFGMSLKAIGWGAIIALALELANTFIDIATGADIAARELETFNNIKAHSDDVTNKNITAIEAEIAAEKKRLVLKVADGKATEEQANAELQLFLQRKKFVGTTTPDFNDPTRTVDVYENFTDNVNTLIKEQQDGIKFAQSSIKSFQKTGAFANRLLIADEKAKIANFKEQITTLTAYKVELGNLNFETEIAGKNFEKFGRNKVEILDGELLKKQNEELRKTIELMTAIRNLEKKEESQETVKLEKNFRKKVKKQENAGGLNIDELKADLKNIESIKIDAAFDELEFQEKIATLTITDQNLLDIKLQELRIEHKNKILKIQEDTAKELAEIRTKQFDLQIKEYDDAEKEKYLSLLESDKSQKEIDAEMLEFQKAQLIERIAWLKKNYPEMTELIRDEEIKLAEMIRKVDDKEDAEAEAAKNKKIQRAAEIADAITAYYIKRADERIAKIDEEIKAAEAQYSHLQTLAENGNINAQQSLAEQQRIIAEANRKKEQEEQRKQRAELVNAALQTYAAKAADPNVENPLLETIRDIALLQQFIATIPAFLDGTEDTGANGQGIDGKGGFNAILHPNERVMTKEQNAKVGNLSNANLAKVAQEYNAGKLVSANNAMQIGGAWESTAVLNELSAIQETIKNKPETNIRLEEIINGALMITRETRKGNSVVFNRYKTKA